MFLIEEAIQQILRLDAGVSARASTRIYPGSFPQNLTYPAVAYRLDTREHPTRLESRGSSGIALSRFEFSIVAQTYLEAKYLDEAIRLSLHGYQATVTRDTGTPETIEIKGIFALTSRDLFQDATQNHYVFSQYNVHHEEVQPT